MATGTLVSVEEYLATTWRPDRDYVEGELVERNTGELSHGRLQTLIAAWLLQREARWRMKAVTEVRLQINSRRFRVPDVMVLSSEAPDEEIVRTPPLLCIEILSRGDTLDFVWDRVEDYFSMGVPACWVIDPIRRRAWTATPGHLAKATDSILRAGDIEMPLADVFK
ncbi:MAG: Uma2 family endonuclease [Bryobacteraceae bacterium]|jgi:Uma2 family endonuclease